MYELKQYEHFANNHLDNHQQYDHFNQHHHVRSYSNGSNYSQNILNYNNSYYKINNINNYNYIKTTKSPTTYRSTDDVDIDNKKWTANYYRSTDNKMEHNEDIRAVERSHLVKEREANGGHNVTIHNFSGNNHTTVHVPSNTVIDDEEQEFPSQKPSQKHSGNPFQQSHHLTQVS